MPAPSPWPSTPRPAASPAPARCGWPPQCAPSPRSSNATPARSAPGGRPPRRSSGTTPTPAPASPTTAPCSSPAPLREPPAALDPGLPHGPAADPAAAPEPPDDPDRFRDRELEVVARFADRLRGQGLSEATVGRHASNAGTFVEFLAWFQGVPVRAVTEFDLRLFLYEWYPRKVYDARTRALAAPTSLRRFFTFLAEDEGVVCPWADPVLRDKDAFELRLDTFPGGHWWDEAVGDWRAGAYADLDARAFLPADAMAGGSSWGDTMGPDEASLHHELQRRWLLRRDDVILAGATTPDAVRTELRRRQHAWESSPHPAFRGKTPVQVVKAERKRYR